jgi:hypothetical protein
MYTISLGKQLISSLSISAGPLTPLKFQIFVSGPPLFFKNYFVGMGIPYTVFTLNKQKSWGILYIIFGFSGIIEPAETDFNDF